MQKTDTENKEIKHFTIFGERNSGTNYLQAVLENNLSLEFTNEYGLKHWFIKDFHPRGRPNTTTDKCCIKSLDNSDNTLFIFIVRNPFDWVGAMKKRSYHLSYSNRRSLLNFVKHKYSSSFHRKKAMLKRVHNFTNDPVTNTLFIDNSDNIVTIRNEKNVHFYNLKDTVKHFHLIRLEYLYDDIQSMIKKYKIKLKNGNFKLVNYREPTKYEIDEDTKKFMLENLDNKIDHLYYL